MDFLNKRAIWVSIGLGIGAFFFGEIFVRRDNGYFGMGVFFISAVILHIKPELMGKLNKTDDNKADTQLLGAYGRLNLGKYV